MTEVTRREESAYEQVLSAGTQDDQYRRSLWRWLRATFWDSGLPIPGRRYQDFRMWRELTLVPAARRFWRDVRR